MLEPPQPAATGRYASLLPWALLVMGLLVLGEFIAADSARLLKFAVVGGLSGLLLVALFQNFERYKTLIPVLLALLISQTGFAYAWRTGYFTSVNELLTLAILGLWIGRRMLLKQPLFPTRYFSRPLHLFVALAAAGVVTAFFWFKVARVNILVELKAYLLYAFYLFLIPDCIRDQRSLQRTLGLTLLFSLIPLVTALVGGMELSDLAEERLSVDSWGALNVFVGYQLPLVFVALGLMFTQGFARWRVPLILFCGMCCAALVLSKTRTGWIALAGGFVVFALLAQRKALLSLGALILAMAMLLSPLGESLERMFENRLVAETLTPDSSLQHRFVRMEIAWATAAAYPLTGTGWGGFLTLRIDGSLSELSTPLLPRWHNTYLEVLSQLGFPGLIAFLLFWWRILSVEGRRLRRVYFPAERALGVGLFVSLFCCLVYAAGEQQFYKIETASHSYFLAGLLLAAGRMQFQRTAELHRRLRQRAMTHTGRPDSWRLRRKLAP